MEEELFSVISISKLQNEQSLSSKLYFNLEIKSLEGLLWGVFFQSLIHFKMNFFTFGLNNCFAHPLCLAVVKSRVTTPPKISSRRPTRKRTAEIEVHLTLSAFNFCPDVLLPE